jgi:hypothetical protein
MKKLLLLLCVVLLNLNTFAQEDETFTRNYSKVFIKLDTKEQKEHIVKTIAVFVNNEVRIYNNNKIDVYYQVSDVVEGKSKSGYEYQLIKCVTKDSGRYVNIQLFDKQNSLRIHFDDGYVEFYD